MEPQSELIEQSLNAQYSYWVREALDDLCDNFTITDPSISGHPIVYASQGFLKMSGYSRDEVIGKNGRVFQGPATNRRAVMEIREAIREERTIQINLLNYRKDGTPFWMLFHMTPVFDGDDGSVIHFVAVQVPIRGSHRRCRNGITLYEGGSGLPEVLYGSCRREVCSDSTIDLSRVLARNLVLDSDNGALDLEEPGEASDVEKQRAITAINSILSVLTHYSKSTGRLICGKRCKLSGKGVLGSHLIISLSRIKQSFVLIDPHSPDVPLVYASDAFLNLTGYTRLEVLGHDWRFLNGLGTDPSTLQEINLSIQTEQPCTVRILSYRKDSSSFWNILHVASVRNATGKVAYIVQVHIEEGSFNQDGEGLTIQMSQFSVVGAVKVALRTLSMGAGSSSQRLEPAAER